MAKEEVKAVEPVETTVTLGEELAAAQAEEMKGTTDIKIVEKDGAVTTVVTETPPKADNGKTYKSDAINPRNTNAPDAGLTPDGTRIAE